MKTLQSPKGSAGRALPKLVMALAVLAPVSAQAQGLTVQINANWTGSTFTQQLPGPVRKDGTILVASGRGDKDFFVGAGSHRQTATRIVKKTRRHPAEGGAVNRRTALRAIAMAAAWPMLVEAQSSTRKKLPTIHVFEGPD